MKDSKKWQKAAATLGLTQVLVSPIGASTAQAAPTTTARVTPVTQVEPRQNLRRKSETVDSRFQSEKKTSIEVKAYFKTKHGVQPLAGVPLTVITSAGELARTSGGGLIEAAETDHNGGYKFSELSKTDVKDSYRVVVEVPEGYKTTEAYKVVKDGAPIIFEFEKYSR